MENFRIPFRSESKRTWLLRFIQYQDGAVTIEWVVLTSAVVILATGIGGFLIGDGDNSVYNELLDILSRTLDRATLSEAN